MARFLQWRRLDVGPLPPFHVEVLVYCPPDGRRVACYDIARRCDPPMRTHHQFDCIYKPTHWAELTSPEISREIAP